MTAAVVDALHRRLFPPSLIAEATINREAARIAEALVCDEWPQEPTPDLSYLWETKAAVRARPKIEVEERGPAFATQYRITPEMSARALQTRKTRT